MLSILFFSILITEIFCGFWNVIKTFIVINKIDYNRNIHIQNKVSKAKIIIVIPCLKEQSIIEETIDYFLTITRMHNNVELAIVTTEKEEYENSLNKTSINTKTTSKIIKEYLTKNNLNTIKHFHYPYKKGIMADQLNYVMEKYKNENFKKTYFSIYNADSRPSNDTITSVLKIIDQENFPYVIQQYSYAFSNLSQLSFIMKGFALYQSNFEIKSGLSNTFIFPNFLYTYVVGHGLYIRFDLLKELGGFDNKFWCEDIFLSSIIRNKNIKITPVLTLENMETPKKISILMKQNANWFKTANQLIQMIKSNLKKKGKLSFSAKMWFLQRTRMNLSWILLPVFVFYTFIFSIYNHNIVLLLISILSYIFMQICIYLSTLFIIEKLESKKISHKFLLINAVCISTFISNIGPIYSLINRKMKKYKTER